MGQLSTVCVLHFFVVLCSFVATMPLARPKQIARIWVGCARLVAADSSTLCKMRLDDMCLLRLFVKSAPNTLRRHLSGWRVWASFCATLQWHAGAPSLQQVLDFGSAMIAGEIESALRWACSTV